MEVDIISESRQESIAGDELQRGHKMTFQQGGGEAGETYMTPKVTLPGCGLNIRSLPTEKDI